jgi:1-acyl-sn-glycerol-3-phosphate acyltransferase
MTAWGDEVAPQRDKDARLAGLARLTRRLFGDQFFFLLARLTYRLRVEGEWHIPAAGPCLFAIRHESLMTDALIYWLVRATRPDVSIFAWQHLQGQHPMRDFLQAFGETDLETRYLPAYKAAGLSAAELLRARRTLLGGGAILLSPEGELTWDGRLQHPLAPGTAWLALRTGAPVIPIATTGGYDIWPRWRLERPRLTGRVTLHVGSPLVLTPSPVEQLDRQMLTAANQRIWEAMAAMLPAGQLPVELPGRADQAPMAPEGPYETG